MKICDKLLNGCIVFSNSNRVNACCRDFGNGQGRAPYGVAPELSAMDIVNGRQDIINAINNNTIFECDGCPCIVNSSNNPTVQYNELVFEHNVNCNLDCIYCALNNKQELMSSSNDVIRIFDEIINNKLLNPTGWILISGGEPSIIKDYDYIIPRLMEYSPSLNYVIFTTAIKYSQVFEDVIKYHKSIMLISVDAATPETYQVIKGRNAFNVVIDNIKQYTVSNTSNVRCKMIIMDENVNEVEQFVNLMYSIGVRHLMYDTAVPRLITPHVMNGIYKFIVTCQQYHDLKYYHGESGLIYDDKSNWRSIIMERLRLSKHNPTMGY